MRALANRLTYANVMSTLAVFLVLAGGIAAAAISGSGSVKFGGQKGLVNGEWVTVLNLPGIGKLQAFCGKSTDLGFKNTSGKKLQATASTILAGSDTSEAVDGALAHGARLDIFAATGDEGLSTARFHVFRPGKEPIAEITASHRYDTGDFSCAKRSAVAQALASE